MCRACVYDDNGNLIGGRRCASDNSEARRARRNNARLLTQYKTSPTSPTSPDYRIAEPEEIENLNLVSLNQTEQPAQLVTIESIQAQAEEIQALQEIVSFNSTHTNWTGEFPKKVELADGTKVYAFNPMNIVIINPDEEDDQDLANERIVNRPNLTWGQSTMYLTDLCERLTLQIGHDVNQLVTEQTGIKDEDIAAISKEAIGESEARFNSLVAEEDSLRQEEILYAHSKDKMYRELRNDGDEHALELWKRHAELTQEIIEARTILSVCLKEASGKTQELLEKKQKTLVDVLAKIRPLGGTLEVSEKSSKPAAKILQEALAVYPTAWIEASNAKESPLIKKTTSRAHYSDGAWQQSYVIKHIITNDRKDLDWKPNPLEKYSVSYEKIEAKWRDTDKNEAYYEWTDENGNLTHTMTKADQSLWKHTSVEYYSSIYNATPDKKPKGNGWQRAVHVDTIVENGIVVEREKTMWWRPVKRRTPVEGWSQAEITVSGTGEKARSVALHEFAHRTESTKKIGYYIQQVEEAFLRRRTTQVRTIVNGDGKEITAPLREDLQRIYDGKKEYGRPDNFTDLYMGKEYQDGYREVLSTGAEAIFSNSFGSLIGLAKRKADYEMKDLIVGFWASA